MYIAYSGHADANYFGPFTGTAGALGGIEPLHYGIVI